MNEGAEKIKEERKREKVNEGEGEYRKREKKRKKMIEDDKIDEEKKSEK